MPKAAVPWLISAELAEGVLTLTLQKAKSAAQRRIEVR
jgi:HSP20 family molecular chaperone IbpA